MGEKKPSLTRSLLTRQVVSKSTNQSTVLPRRFSAHEKGLVIRLNNQPSVSEKLMFSDSDSCEKLAEIQTTSSELLFPCDAFQECLPEYFGELGDSI